MKYKSIENTNIRGFISWIFRHPLIAVTPLIICIFATLANILIGTKEYQQTMAFTLNSSTNGTATTKDILLFNDISAIKKQPSFENEKELLGSPLMAEELIKLVDLQNEVYLDKGITSKLLYNESPISFRLIADNNCKTFYARAFATENNVTLSDITINGEKASNKMNIPYGIPKKTDFGIITIKKNGIKSTPQKLILNFRNSKIVTNEIIHNLRFYKASIFSTVLYTNYTDKSPERAKDIVNNIPNAYNNLWHNYIETKAEQIDSTITQQLKLIIRELIQNENDIIISNSKFKDNNSYKNFNSIKKDLFFAARTLNYILNNDKFYTLIPKVLTDYKLNSKIDEYNTLINRLKSMLSKGRIYPSANIIEQKALQLKVEIITTLEEHIEKSVEKLNKLKIEPNNAKTLLPKGDKHNSPNASKLRRIWLLHKNYLYLKHKQEEYKIAKSVKLNRIRIIRKALPEAKMVSPNTPSAIFLTLLFGLILIPYSIYLTSSTINSKRNSPKE